MSLFIQILISRLLVFVAFSILNYSIGHAIVIAFKKHITIHGKLTSFFVKSVLGILLITLIYSLVKSKLLTVNITLLPLLILGIISVGKDSMTIGNLAHINLLSKNNFYLAIISTLLIGFSFAFYKLYSLSDIPYTYQNQDFVYYSDIVNCLTTNGIENYNTYSYLIDPAYNEGINPFHYFELWISSFIIFLFKIKPIEALLLIQYGYFVSLIIVGILSLLEQFNKLSFNSIIITFTILLFGVIYHKADLFEYVFLKPLLPNPFNLFREKYIILYVIWTTATILLINNNQKIGILFLLSSSFFSAAYLPGIYLGLFCYSLITLINKKNVYPLITTLVSILSFSLFYLFAKKNEFTFRSKGSILEYTDIKSFDLLNIKIASVEALYRIYNNYMNEMIILFALFILYFIVRSRVKTTKEALLISTLVLLGGIIASTVFYKVRDANQFFTSINFLFPISFLLLFLPLSKKTSKISMIISVVLLTFSISVIGYNTFNYKVKNLSLTDQNYYSEIEDYISKDQNTKYLGCYIKAEYEYNTISSKNSLVAKPGLSVVPYIDNIITSFDISLHSINTWSRTPHFYETEKRLVASSPFMNYIEKLKSKNEFISIENAQLSFIKNNNINFLIATKDANVPDHLYQLVSKTIINRMTGERFMFFNDYKH